MRKRKKNEYPYKCSYCDEKAMYFYVRDKGKYRYCQKHWKKAKEKLWLA